MKATCGLFSLEADEGGCRTIVGNLAVEDAPVGIRLLSVHIHVRVQHHLLGFPRQPIVP